MKWKIDSSDSWINYHLACCECGWRQPATSYDTALYRLRLHELHIHPEEVNARKAFYRKSGPASKPTTRRKDSRRPKMSNP